MSWILPQRTSKGIFRLRRDGNSLVLPLGRPLLRFLGWKKGDFVAALVDGGMLKVTKIDLEKVTGGLLK